MWAARPPVQNPSIHVAVESHPSAKNALGWGTLCVGDAHEIKSLGGPPEKFEFRCLAPRDVREDSCAPSGTCSFFTCTHGLRRGLCSTAASRLISLDAGLESHPRGSPLGFARGFGTNRAGSNVERHDVRMRTRRKRLSSPAPRLPQRLEAAVDFLAFAARVELVPFPFLPSFGAFRELRKA